MTDDLKSHLPLAHLEFAVLISLARRDLHGYGMALEIAERSNGVLEPSMSSLYLAIRRLAAKGFVEDAGRHGDDSGGPARRYYRITDLGRQLAQLEAARLQDQARVATDLFRTS